MKLTFIGAAHEVTGSCTLLEACGKNILIDCGMEQGENVYENAELPIALNKIDAMLLTHAHIDHSGKIPYAVKNGLSAPIYTTEATARLCNIMLMDSAHIQMFEAEWQNRKRKRSNKEVIEPLYTTDDVQDALRLFQPCVYKKEYTLFDSIEIKFIDVGHLLGSASIQIKVTENGQTKTILFSGDVGNINRPLIKDPQNPESADYVVIESTYGNRLHEERQDYIGQLKDVIQSTFDRGGNVVIPSFAVGRTQELLYILRIIKEQNMIKNHDGFEVWVDSPLASEATEIYDDKTLIEYFDKETLELLDKGINPIKFNGLKISTTSNDSIAINNDPRPKVILSASGMCEAGRIRHHLKHNLWREDCTILFVGYQANGTLGRKIVEGASTVKLFGEEIRINAKIEKMDGISGHADMNMLLDWLGSLNNKPQKVFVNHGHDSVCDEFAKTIEDKLGFCAVAPYSGDVFELTDTAIQTVKAQPVRFKKVSPKAELVNSIFEKLRLSGVRLMGVIEKNKGGTNKDLSSFAEQINALCEKWDK